MQIVSLPAFLEYFEKIHQRTRRVVDCVPPDEMDWTYQTGRFTFADLIRHIAAIERYMYAENAQFKRSIYPGHGKELADAHDMVIRFFEEKHRESMEIFSKLTDKDLQKKCLTPNGTPITLWKWLRAMVEHEIHHRGQIYLYLSLLNLPAPPLYGLTSEEVFKLSNS